MSEYFEELSQFFSNCGKQVVPDAYLERIMQRVTRAPSHVDSPGVHYRASKIGRPFVLQAIERWYGGKRPMTAANALAMLNGNIAQEVVAELLELTGVKFKQEQRMERIGIAGHSDFVITGDDADIVVECKSMAPHVFQRFYNSPTDDYGYLSQLAFYTDCHRRATERPVVPCFLLFNRGTSEFRMVRIAEHAIDSRIERYENAVPQLLTVSDYDMQGLLRVVQPPPCIGGKLPVSMVNTKWHQYMYEMQGGWWDRRAASDIVERFGELAAQRADRQALQYRGES